MELLVKFLVTPVVLLGAARFVPGVSVEGIYTALIVAVILGLINLIVRPILLLLSLPITIITFGLFVFVINGALLWFVATFIEGFAFSGFFPAFVTALLISLGQWIADSLAE